MCSQVLLSLSIMSETTCEGCSPFVLAFLVLRMIDIFGTRWWCTAQERCLKWWAASHSGDVRLPSRRSRGGAKRDSRIRVVQNDIFRPGAKSLKSLIYSNSKPVISRQSVGTPMRVLSQIQDEDVRIHYGGKISLQWMNISPLWSATSITK